MQSQTDSSYENLVAELVQKSKYDLTLPTAQLSDELSSDIRVVSRYALIPPSCRAEAATKDVLFWSQFALDPRYFPQKQTMSIAEAVSIADKVAGAARGIIEENSQTFDKSKSNDVMKTLHDQILKELDKHYLLI